jgi:hypothetical protein
MRGKSDFFEFSVMRNRESLQTNTVIKKMRVVSSFLDGRYFCARSGLGPGKGLLAEPLDASQAQRERLAFLELRAFFTGELRRSDIAARFGIKPAASSRDLALYREVAPGNLEYDATGRCYRPSASFEPVFPFNSDRVMAWLLQGFGDGLDLGLKQAAPCEGPGQLNKPDLKVLGSITRSMCAKRPVRMNYLSLSSGAKRRDVVPVALADNGLRWHVRAYDRERGRFGDFVLTRISKVNELAEQARESELLGADEQWARMVEMELAPHPGLKHPQVIESDYGMEGGCLRLKTRAALAGYVLRRWNVDASEHHFLEPTTHQLWLRNSQTLYGVESAVLAPGYQMTT